MDVSYLLDSLNDAQREAVSSPVEHRLVLAGAGSGKTRVLVHRIAWLMRVEGASPFGVLAVTFTNKAAAEMRVRLDSLLGIPISGMWVGTFHGIAHRLLRTHWQEAKLPKTFQILDSEDQFRIVKRVHKALELDDTRWPPRQSQWYINGKKDEGLRPQHLDDHGDFQERKLIEIYQAYEASCQKSGVVDFAELLLRAHELLRDSPTLLAHYQNRFRHILVDEFQDTNTLQYAWLRLLAGKEGKLFVVGDDDQSIYGWRGAKIENIQRLNEDFPNVGVIRLEQNYRSTSNILSAANAIIEQNENRMGKKLWTADGQGEPILLYRALNELDEAQFVAERIQKLSESEGHSRNDFALLYRSNAQSRVLEEALIRAGLPYRIYGGLRFFERAEIKDAMAYLRLLKNRDDDTSFERVVNTPTRGIGQRTLDSIRTIAREQVTSMWRAAQFVVAENELTARAGNAVKVFLSLIDQMDEGTDSLLLHERVEQTIQQSGLIDHYKKEKGEKGQTRIENLGELVTAARYFKPSDDAEETEMDLLDAFLAHAALEAGESQSEPGDDCVQLMTLHSAKGLEFPVVFMCGLEEGLFPHKRSSMEPRQLEEERRLCYVGVTRARKQLILCYAEHRRLYGEYHYPQLSRFVREIPDELLEEVRQNYGSVRPSSMNSAFNSPVKKPPSQTGGLNLGQSVSHARFGQGVVINFEGDGNHARVQVNFDTHGSKWLVLAYAKLKIL
ncbi:MAG TPA: DNA helicase II [Gammaproteobacteria bacterium]|nr:DNA helicase II [Gammaproteobacteria bacterium]